MQERASRHAWFKATILPHESALRRLVRRMATTPHIDVEDVVSETLSRAYMTEGFLRIDHGRAFLFTIARNLMADLARHQAVIPFELISNLESFEPSDPGPSPESMAVARDELRRLRQIVDSLPTQCRQVFLLRRIEELPIRTIAVRMGLSVSTVEKHLSKAMALLTRGMAEGEAVLRDRKEPTWRRIKDHQ